jgi:hypothetical protein
MSDLELSELAEAEVVPGQGGPNAYLVRLGEGQYEMVNKSAKHVLILEDDVLTQDVVSYGGIMVTFNLVDDEITLHDGDNEVTVPSDRHEHVLWSVHDEDGERLQSIFDDLHVPTARQGLMDMLMPRFREAKSDIQKTEDGWLVGGDILISWDGTNHPVDVAQTHVVSGGETVEADEEKEAREIRLRRAYDDMPVTLPNGTETTLDEVEVRFLVTAGLILGTGAPGVYNDELARAVENSEIVGFTDTKSGLHHGHGMQKHTLSDLSVSQDAIDRLWYNEYDHTGVHEMKVRRSEFENAPIDVFTDAANDDARKWEKIENTSEKAPIPKDVRSDLEARYGDGAQTTLGEH